MNHSLTQIINLLNAERYTNGEFIAEQLNITRAAIWKNIQQLRQKYGIEIQSNKGMGYKLKDKLILIDKDKIDQEINACNIKLDVFKRIDSTSTYLQQKTGADQIYVCLTEYQQKGKARFNRHWCSPFGQNIYLSIKTTLQKDLSELSGLSLAVASIIVKTLTTLFPALTPKIKWPNDIYVAHKKLSGNLIEVKAESNFQSQVIIGIGLNVNMQHALTIDQPWTSLRQILGHSLDRNNIIIHLIKNLIAGLERFEKKGFADFIATYKNYDYLKNKTITLEIPDGNSLTGTCQGVNKMGQLLILKAGKSHHFASGEASIDKNSILAN